MLRDIASYVEKRLMGMITLIFFVVEHELLARLVVEAMADSGAERERVGAIVVAQPRPYTRQQYFSTFMTSYLRIPCDGIVMEVLGNGLTGALAFDKALDEVALGRTEVALALGINMETAIFFVTLNFDKTVFRNQNLIINVVFIVLI